MEKESFTQRIASLKLNENALQQTTDQLHRCEVELDVLEQELDGIFRRQEQLRLYLKLKAQLETKQQQLYNLNKQVAAQAIQHLQLERFEDFEVLHNIFQRIHILNEQINDLNLQEQNILADKAVAKAHYETTHQRWTVVSNQCDDAFRATTEGAYKMADAAHHSERINTATDNCRELDKILTEAAPYQNALQQHHINCASLLKEAQQQLDTVLEKLSVLNPHQSMLQHSKAVLTKLENSHYLFQRRRSIMLSVEDIQRKQVQRNEALGNLYVEHQQLVDEISSLENEVIGHQNSIAGQSSYTLQQNAIDSHNRQQMLETGLKTWMFIAESFQLYEDKTENIRVLTRRHDYQHQELDRLKTELNEQEQILDRKREQWLLAKSQDCVQMRDALKEGEPCVVCGATAHPLYNSDMAAQSEHISGWKTDFEAQLRDVETLRKKAETLQLELADIEGQLKMEQHDCLLLQKQQQRQVAVWQPFAQLDKVLADCTINTDREMRVLTLRTLIEQTTVAAEEAQRELDTYSFHINAINVTNDRINEMRRKESDLNVRLNEENTACQVLGQHVEIQRNRMDVVTREFTKIYEQLQPIITLQNWWEEWQVSPESIRLKIQQMASDWDYLKTQEHQLTQDIQIQSQHLRSIESEQKMTFRLLRFMKETQQQFTDDVNEQQQMLNEITSDDEKTPFLLALEHYKECVALFKSATEEDEAAQKTLQRTNMALELLHQQRQASEKQLSDKRMEIDIWMHQYNATHAPVRFEEIKEVFAEDHNWNDLRKSLKELKTKHLICQSEVNLISKQIVALQINGANETSYNGEEELLSLETQQHELSEQRTRLLQQIAQLNNKLHQQELLNNLNT